MKKETIIFCAFILFINCVTAQNNPLLGHVYRRTPNGLSAVDALIVKEIPLNTADLRFPYSAGGLVITYPANWFTAGPPNIRITLELPNGQSWNPTIIYNAIVTQHSTGSSTVRVSKQNTNGNCSTQGICVEQFCQTCTNTTTGVNTALCPQCPSMGCQGSCPTSACQASTCSNCASPCNGQCTSCAGSCNNQCNGECNTCTGSCDGQTNLCGGDCSGTCNNCVGTCTGTLIGSTCNGDCSSCLGICQGICVSNADDCIGLCNTCSGPCSAMTNQPCGDALCTGFCSPCSSAIGSGSCDGKCSNCTGSCSGVLTGSVCTGMCTKCEGICFGTCSACTGTCVGDTSQCTGSAVVSQCSGQCSQCIDKCTGDGMCVGGNCFGLCNPNPAQEAADGEVIIHLFVNQSS